MGLQVENDEGKCEVTEVSKVEGEASINNRKGKLIFFYEWNLKAKWKGENKIIVKHIPTCNHRWRQPCTCTEYMFCNVTPYLVSALREQESILDLFLTS